MACRRACELARACLSWLGVASSYTEGMARQPAKNPPQTFGARYRLIVKARPQLPKRFIWEIVTDDGKGMVTALQTSQQSYDTMEAAYEKGTPILAEVRARHTKV